MHVGVVAMQRAGLDPERVHRAHATSEGRQRRARGNRFLVRDGHVPGRTSGDELVEERGLPGRGNVECDVVEWNSGATKRGVLYPW